MKKAIVIVSALGLLLSVNFAMARPPVPLSNPVDPVIQYILDWLTTLQQQVNNIESPTATSTSVITIWDDFEVSTSTTFGPMLDTSGSLRSTVGFAWTGEVPPPTCYLHVDSYDENMNLIDGTGLYSIPECHATFDVLLNYQVRYIQLSAWTPSFGTLNTEIQF